ncbi:aerobic-type carbon monoxide dehydrogenase, middle subunit CoxM/CutM [Gottschalkia purinilytica]|uniref:Aerobic-type carbon monoxide dehydrogenase, middle subunit CoxM/CutM n=1 Tax=Gottschalkia purinilytica TaxID=1503 RepID=A0A0L0W9U5_GOTPU|nr:FAD binding domain-containing protein [Gottschalkia purinilytica]KNF08075.1 aerobic-type carbon monoxide dehydrogenase, middle subunit CoxM/CutM [Gottschalkia purinilytica]
MITIKEYIVPKSIEEAYEQFSAKKKSTLIGGGAFIRMGSKNIPAAIDLSKAGLDYIKENEDTIEIGAMTTFGDIEHSELLKEHFNGVLPESVKEIVGMQLRNLVTVGGTVYTRYGFSDFLAGLLTLDVQVKLYKQGLIPLDKFLEEGAPERDILECIIIKKENRKAAYKAVRNSMGDYAILNVGASKLDNDYRLVVGARPRRATLAKGAMEYLNKNGATEENIDKACDMASEEIVFGDNARGSKEYRKSVSKVLLKRALMEVVNNDY